MPSLTGKGLRGQFDLALLRPYARLVSMPSLTGKGLRAPFSFGRPCFDLLFQCPP